jgi:hypothetical protein
MKSGFLQVVDFFIVQAYLWPNYTMHFLMHAWVRKFRFTQIIIKRISA